MVKKEAAAEESALTQKQQVSQEDHLAKQQADEEALNKLLFYGDLSSLGIAQQREYCFQLAKVMGLNPWTKPFDMITDSKGRLFVYANKGCAAQLRHTRSITLETIYEGPLKLGDKYNYGIYTVVVEAAIPDRDCPGGQRKVRNVGSVSIDQLIGEALSNAVMKCYTKAIRRATLDVCGIGFPDESELDSMGAGQREPQPQTFQPRPRPAELPQVATVGGEKVDTKSGEILAAVPVPPAAAQPLSNVVGSGAPEQPIHGVQRTEAPAAGRSKFPPAVAPVGVPSAKP